MGVPAALLAWLPHVNWHEMFVPHVSLVEIVLRASLIYLALFFLLRIGRSRHAGQMGLADILVIVLIADAVSNGMTVEYKSIPEALVLAGTIFFWSYALDWLEFNIAWLRPLLESKPELLVRDGRLQQRAMRHEMLTRDNLMGMLRERGIEDIAEVKRAYIEGDGALSVLCFKDGKQRPAQESKKKVV